MSDKIVNKPDEDEEKGFISRFLKKEKVLKIIVFIGLVGIALIFFSSVFTPSVSDDDSTEEKSTQMQSTNDLIQYQQDLCDELGNMLASIDGVGKTKVMLTMEQSVQNVYATDDDIQQKESSQKSGESESTDKQNSEKTSYIIVRQSDGSEKALTVSQIMPKVKGVLVVCEGGENAVVRKNVTEAVSAILDISSAHICVTKLSG